MQLIRPALAFSLMGLQVLLAIPVLILLLPWRRQRIIYSAHVARWIGRSINPILGIHIDYQGHDLRESFPAIYIFNHASNLDFFALLPILPPGVCGIAKREMLYFPLIGQLYWLAGHPLLDRARPDKARATFNRATDYITQQGLGLFMAPEGTRSRSGQLGPFKKGFAHAALATGLPIVPIIIHGSHALWPPGSLNIRPGQLRIEILEPIPTEDWSEDRRDQHIQAIRDTFTQHLSPNRTDAS